MPFRSAQGPGIGSIASSLRTGRSSKPTDALKYCRRHEHGASASLRYTAPLIGCYCERHLNFLIASSTQEGEILP